MADTCVDLEAREGIASLDTKLEKVSGVVWGADMKNGLRSRVTTVESKLVELETYDRQLGYDLKHYLEVDREATCPTRKLVEDHVLFHQTQKESNNELEIAKINAEANKQAAIAAAQAAVESARANAKAASWKEIAMLAGILLTAVGQMVSTSQNARIQKDLLSIQKEMPPTRYPSSSPVQGAIQ